MSNVKGIKKTKLDRLHVKNPIRINRSDGRSTIGTVKNVSVNVKGVESPVNGVPSEKTNE